MLRLILLNKGEGGVGNIGSDGFSTASLVDWNADMQALFSFFFFFSLVRFDIYIR